MRLRNGPDDATNQRVGRQDRLPLAAKKEMKREKPTTESTKPTYPHTLREAGDCLSASRQNFSRLTIESITPVVRSLVPEVYE